MHRVVIEYRECAAVLVRVADAIQDPLHVHANQFKQCLRYIAQGKHIRIDARAIRPNCQFQVFDWPCACHSQVAVLLQHTHGVGRPTRFESCWQGLGPLRHWNRNVCLRLGIWLILHRAVTRGCGLLFSGGLPGMDCLMGRWPLEYHGHLGSRTGHGGGVAGQVIEPSRGQPTKWPADRPRHLRSEYKP